jgi:hypothetical protein
MQISGFDIEVNLAFFSGVMWRENSLNLFVGCADRLTVVVRVLAASWFVQTD